MSGHRGASGASPLGDGDRESGVDVSGPAGHGIDALQQGDGSSSRAAELEPASVEPGSNEPWRFSARVAQNNICEGAVFDDCTIEVDLSACDGLPAVFHGCHVTPVDLGRLADGASESIS